jgi:hypothetical protein
MSSMKYKSIKCENFPKPSKHGPSSGCGAPGDTLLPLDLEF